MKLALLALSAVLAQMPDAGVGYVADFCAQSCEQADPAIKLADGGFWISDLRDRRIACILACEQRRAEDAEKGLKEQPATSPFLVILGAFVGGAVLVYLCDHGKLPGCR